MTDPTSIDYEETYRNGTLIAGVSMAKPPWDTGEPEPLLVELAEAGRITGDVLDVGCGPGDNASYLAARGHRVTGVDAAPTAIEQARTRASARGVEVEFAVADAAELAGIDGPFDTVVSSLLLHCLDPDQRRAHVAALGRVLRPGGRLIQSCFAADGPTARLTPYPLTEDELRTTFSEPDWIITTLRVGRITGTALPAPAVEMLRAHGIELDHDETGELLFLPALILEATRGRRVSPAGC